MIPTLIAPVYNRFDLLERMLRSIDVEVGATVVIDNSGSGHRLLEMPELEHLKLCYLDPLSSLGYGGSINLGIRQTPDSAWWLWASNDVAFRPGELAAICTSMTGTAAPLVVTSACTWGAVNPAAWDAAGEWDEWSFWPIYFDDNDWQRRCLLAGVEWVERPGAAVHGDDVLTGSATIHSDPATKRANDRTFPINAEAYVAKWGGLPREERFTTPWDSGLPVWVTRPSIAGRRRRSW